MNKENYYDYKEELENKKFKLEIEYDDLEERIEIAKEDKEPKEVIEKLEKEFEKVDEKLEEVNNELETLGFDYTEDYGSTDDMWEEC